MGFNMKVLSEHALLCWEMVALRADSGRDPSKCFLMGICAFLNRVAVALLGFFPLELTSHLHVSCSLGFLWDAFLFSRQ